VKTKPKMGRPISVNCETQVVVRGPRTLFASVAQRAKAEGITISEGWRRAGREWAATDMTDAAYALEELQDSLDRADSAERLACSLKRARVAIKKARGR
jgi:hypothetical protein